MKQLKGFSLIELVIGVSIFLILVSIGVPQLRNFRYNAIRKSAQTELAALHTSQMLFKAEWGTYYGSFATIGYNPKGDQHYNVGFAEAWGNKKPDNDMMSISPPVRPLGEMSECQFAAPNELMADMRLSCCGESPGSACRTFSGTDFYSLTGTHDGTKNFAEASNTVVFCEELKNLKDQMLYLGECKALSNHPDLKPEPAMRFINGKCLSVGNTCRDTEEVLSNMMCAKCKETCIDSKSYYAVALTTLGGKEDIWQIDNCKEVINLVNALQDSMM